MMRILGSFGHPRSTATRDAHNDRRAACRYPAVGNDARLGWWAGEDFHEVSARLEDISQGGASILADQEPPTAEVFLRLVQPAETGWVEASVLRASATPEGPYRLGAEFPVDCPYELFKEASGNRLERPVGAVCPEFDGRHLR